MQNSQVRTRASFFSVLQKVGQSLMVPVTVLPAAGLLVAFGRLIQRAGEDNSGAILKPVLHAFGDVLFNGGLAIFQQLPLVFAIGVAIGFTGGAGVAGLASAIGYFTMTNVLKAMGTARGLELAIDTGVFGGIITGLVVAQLYNRYHTIKLHPVFGFFSGKRLIPILGAAASLGVGLILAFVWPPIQTQINAFGIWVMSSDIGPAFYAAGKRLLIPLGLHHVYYPPFLYQFGEYVTAAGKVVHGETARYFAGDTTAGRFMASEFPLMLFGLPAAALAMTLRAPKERRKAVGGVMLAAALTSILTGITEPIEFAFIFVAPFLFVFHVIAAFASGWLTNAFDIHLGYTFSASLIDFAVGFFNQRNAWALFAVVGPLMSVLYFTVFYYGIELLGYKTPGREDDYEASEEAPASVSPAPTGDASQRSANILAALGGAKNISNIDACITRLRLELKDTSIVDQARLRGLGASGVLKAGPQNMQVVFGVESDSIKDDIKKLMASGSVAPVAAAPRVKTPAGFTKATKAATREYLCAPIKGELLPLEMVPDATFAEKIMGEGFAIRPTEGVVHAPLDATVSHVFRTEHALGLQTDSGLEVLIHVGIDTVKMEGRGFKALVKSGDRVHVGQKILEFDLALVTAEAKSTITPVVVTNLENQTWHYEVEPNTQISSGYEVGYVTLQNPSAHHPSTHVPHA